MPYHRFEHHHHSVEVERCCIINATNTHGSLTVHFICRNDIQSPNTCINTVDSKRSSLITCYSAGANSAIFWAYK